MPAPQPSNMVVYVQPDGTLTVDFLKFLQLLAAMLDDHESRLVAGGL